MTKLKVTFLSVLFGCLAIAIVLLGAFLSVILIIMLPFFIVFTVLWISWLIHKEHQKELKSDSGSDPNEPGPM